VRADSSVTELDYCVTDNNGQICGVASPVTPDPTLSQQYPAYSQEYRFTYSPVASNGTATITVKLKDVASSVYTNRFATLTRTVNTLAPATVLFISSPASDGQAVVVGSNDVYTISSCFTSSLTPNNYNFFSIYINGVFQPRQDIHGNVLYHITPLGCATGLRQLYYNWTGFSPGTNIIQIDFTNGIPLSATRTVLVGIMYSSLDSDGDGVPDWKELLAGTDPYNPNSFFRITELVTGNPVELVWSSVPNKTYQVLATTNLNFPMAPISDAVVMADPSNPVTHWFDLAPDATNRLNGGMYRIQVLP
jgi:hypothetical protein